MIKISNLWRKLDNSAKAFSLNEKNNNNIFRLSVILKEQIDPIILKTALTKTLNTYSYYKVRIKSGFFWNYLETNSKDPIIEKENQVPCKSVNFEKNNEYLFKITYFSDKINLDIFHVLTDGVGATKFLKEIIYNYLNLKYNLKTNKKQKNTIFNQDEYLKKVDKKLKYKEKHKTAFLINEKSDLVNNKTYHYILDLEKFKKICKKNNVSITEYLTALYIYAIYKTIYDKNSNKDIVITIPIDLRKYYQVQSNSNFFTCMNIEGNVLNNKNITFKTILNQVHKEFKTKLTNENIPKYLARDVNLGTNIGIRLVPLFIKKLFMKYLSKIVNQSSTTTLSNIGAFKIDEKYKKYIDNIIVLTSTGKIEKIKCTICSYENNLTITLNSNLINTKLENEFYYLLKKHIGKFRLESNII